MFHTILVVVDICSGAKLNFLDRDRDLFLLRLVRLLLGFVLKLAKVDYSANRGICIGSHFNEVQASLAR
jgi:hypothetical protein